MRGRVTLYGNDVWTSPYILTVFVALEEKRIPYELAEAQWLRPSVRAFVDRPRPPYAAAIITPGSPRPHL